MPSNDILNSENTLLEDVNFDDDAEEPQGSEKENEETPDWMRREGRSRTGHSRIEGEERGEISRRLDDIEQRVGRIGDEMKEIRANMVKVEALLADVLASPSSPPRGPTEASKPSETIKTTTPKVEVPRNEGGEAKKDQGRRAQRLAEPLEEEGQPEYFVWPEKLPDYYIPFCMSLFYSSLPLFLHYSTANSVRGVALACILWVVGVYFQRQMHNKFELVSFSLRTLKYFYRLQSAFSEDDVASALARVSFMFNAMDALNSVALIMLALISCGWVNHCLKLSPPFSSCRRGHCWGSRLV